jgi:hypothetical protein
MISTTPIIIKPMSKLTRKLISLFAILHIGCTHQILNYNKDVILSSHLSKKGIIVSCTRCTCINDFLHSEAFFKQMNSNIGLYIDSSCSPDFLKEYKPTYIRQRLIDSISSENYNMMFYKILDNSEVNLILIKTEDNPEKKMKQFFK